VGKIPLDLGFLKIPNTSNFQNLDISLHYLTWNIYIYNLFEARRVYDEGTPDPARILKFCFKNI
jgi:hypothetical protein